MPDVSVDYSGLASSASEVRDAANNAIDLPTDTGAFGEAIAGAVGKCLGAWRRELSMENEGLNDLAARTDTITAGFGDADAAMAGGG